MWIFKSGLQDFYKIYLPGLIGLFLVSFTNYDNLNLVFYLIIFHIIDVGHLYATMLRTIFDKHELKHNYKTLAVPILIVIISFLWLYFKVPYFWTFYILFTIFHNLRQGWGIVRWYEKKNKKFHKNEWFYYIFTIVPFILFHLKGKKENLIYYNQGDYDNFKFLYQNIDFSIGNYSFHQENILFTLFLGLYLISLILWLFQELRYAYKNKLEYNRLAAMLYFSSVYAYAFLFATSEFQISVMLILSHALPYVFIMDKFLNFKVKENSRKFFVLASALLIGGAINLLIEDAYELESVFNYTKATISPLEYFITLIYVTPIFAHYLWDMYLWRKDHNGNNELYSD